ncbi:thiolase domain-containing protein [Candidatus Peregrinibacteria bacterium]|nr:thiolase domain-containing protein [Candidatus Peregrinibacteria bacterium]
MQCDVFLVGTGQTRFGELFDRSTRDVMEEAIGNAIENSGLTSLDIDMVVVANMLAEQTNNQAHLGSLASQMLPHHPPALRVEAACGSGAVALHTATALLESKRAETVLVVGVEKMTDASTEDVSTALMGAADSELDQPSGLTFPGIFGLIAQRYMHEYGLTREQLSLVSALHHRNGMRNPFAQFRIEVTPEAVSQSSPVADPLRLLDCSPISDGAAACILSTLHRSPLRLAASQIATDTLSIAQRATLTSFSASKEAMERALREAEIDRDEIKALETHDCFSIAALINLEDLGFAEPGEGIRLYEALYKGRATSLMINRSGGLKACGHPVAATGVKQLCDIGKQLISEKKQWGIAHNFGGACASCGIHLLENLDA